MDGKNQAGSTLPAAIRRETGEGRARRAAR
jgi:hypothetical protein